MLHVTIYIVNNLSAESMREIEKVLSELKLDYPDDILSFRVVPGKGEITILTRKNSQEVIDHAESRLEKVLDKLNLKIQQKIRRAAQCQYKNMRTLTSMLILRMFIDSLMTSPSETTITKAFKLLHHYLENNTEFKKLLKEIINSDLPRDELLIALALYALGGECDIRSLAGLCNLTLSIDFETLTKALQSLESRGLIRIKNRNFVSSTPTLDNIADRILSTFKSSFEEICKSANEMDPSLFLKEVKDKYIYILHQNSFKKFRLSEAIEKIVPSFRLNNKSVLPLVVYSIIESRGGVISKELLENVISYLAEFTQ